MGAAERKGAKFPEREKHIIAAARGIAEAEGWSAVTIRRLAEEIAHSQPVIYCHFDNRDAIVAAVAIEGFRELALALRRAAQGMGCREASLRNVAQAYLAFASARPATYEAMFTLPTGLRFANAGTRPELRDAFAALAAVVAPTRSDREVATEAFWAALHGLVTLERAGRIRRSARDERIALVVRGLIEC